MAKFDVPLVLLKRHELEDYWLKTALVLRLYERLADEDEIRTGNEIDRGLEETDVDEALGAARGHRKGSKVLEDLFFNKGKLSYDKVRGAKIAIELLPKSDSESADELKAEIRAALEQAKEYESG